MRSRKNRQYYRAKYFAEVKALNYPDGSQDKKSAKPMELIILNLSIDGVGVLSREDIKEGSIFTFTLYLGGIGHELMAYSTFCIKLGEMYRVGLKLITPDNLFSAMLMEYIKSEKNSNEVF
ncbi:MAG: hypothetical protein ACOZCL_08710 [Bacillota bacterium]